MSELKQTYEYTPNPVNSVLVDEKQLVFAALRDLIPRQRQAPDIEQPIKSEPAINTQEKAWQIRKAVRRATEA